MANVNQQSVTDVMNKNPIYEGLMETVHGDLKTTTSSFKAEERQLQAKATVQATQEASQKTAPVKAFGERQRRRNPPKKRKKK
jgi:hypothetical protein